MRHIKIN